MNEPQVTIDYALFRRLESAEKTLNDITKDSDRVIKYISNQYGTWYLLTKDETLLDMVTVLKKQEERLSKAEDFLRSKGYDVWALIKRNDKNSLCFPSQV